MQVGDIMTSGANVPTSSPDATLMSELVNLSSKGCGCLLVRAASCVDFLGVCGVSVGRVTTQGALLHMSRMFLQGGK